MTDPATRFEVAVVGGGPAGLMAAEIISAAGRPVVVYDRMTTVGRKFLMAGRGGLNLTHSEPLERLLGRYGAAEAWLRPALAAFGPADLVRWAEGLGQSCFTGSSGRIFPTALKASPLLRAWIARLVVQGVVLRTGQDWQGWDDRGALCFRQADGQVERRHPAATVLALGGASWPRLGATGSWLPWLAGRGVAVAPFRPANCGFAVAWSDPLRRFAGTPLNGIAVAFAGQRIRGEAVITAYGLEGGAFYALSAALREAIAAAGPVTITLDLRPEQSQDDLAVRLARPRGRQSLSTYLRRCLNLAPAAVALLHEGHGRALPAEPGRLAALIKAVPLTLTAPAGLARAISSAGGVTREAVDDTLMLRALPGVFAAGEMLDWEAPTGGYLVQACLATGAAAGRAVLAWLDRNQAALAFDDTAR